MTTLKDLYRKHQAGKHNQQTHGRRGSEGPVGGPQFGTGRRPSDNSKTGSALRPEATPTEVERRIGQAGWATHRSGKKKIEAYPKEDLGKFAVHATRGKKGWEVHVGPRGEGRVTGFKRGAKTIKYDHFVRPEDAVVDLYRSGLITVEGEPT